MRPGAQTYALRMPYDVSLFNTSQQHAHAHIEDIHLIHVFYSCESVSGVIVVCEYPRVHTYVHARVCVHAQ
jgi:hypothetical protein